MHDSYRPMESLMAGTEVVAHFAGITPMKATESLALCRVDGVWTGHRGQYASSADGILPIGRSLSYSIRPAFLDGLPMPAGDLANGPSIVLERVEGRDSLEFFHIELARQRRAGAASFQVREPFHSRVSRVKAIHSGLQNAVAAYGFGWGDAV
jgi:hypothetical protein